VGTAEVLAIGALGVGVAGVAVGSVFGLSSKSKRDEADLYCAGSACTDPRGVELRGDALDAGNISTIAFIIGGIGVAAGTVLWITHPSEKPQASTGLAPRVGIQRPPGAFAGSQKENWTKPLRGSVASHRGRGSLVPGALQRQCESIS
jgi:hypothetical protein